jgi:sugar phosphate isomerase/epimerase
VKLSCAAYSWPTLSASTVFTIVSELGFGGIDLAIFGNDSHVTMSSVMEAPEAAAGEMRRLADAHGLVVADVFLIPSNDLAELSPNHPDPAVRAASVDIFLRTLAFASALGAPGVTILPGVRHFGEPVDEAISRASEALAMRAELAAERDLELSVEGHFGSCVERPDSFLDLLDRTPNLWATLDPSHFAFTGSSAEDLRPLLPRSRHIQVRPCGTGLMQGRLVDNEFDYASFVAGMKDCHYDRFVATEFVWMEKWSCDRVDNTCETARLKDYLIALAEACGI